MVDLPPSPRVVIHPRCSGGTDLPRDCRQSGHWAVAQGVAWGLEVCNEVPTGALGLEKLREGSRAQSWQLTPRVLAPLWPSSVTILSSQKYKDTQNGGCFPGRKGDPRVAVAPGGEEAVPDRTHSWLTGHHVPLCRGALPAFPSAFCGHRQGLPGWRRFPGQGAQSRLHLGATPTASAHPKGTGGAEPQEPTSFPEDQDPGLHDDKLRSGAVLLVAGSGVGFALETTGDGQ